MDELKEVYGVFVVADHGKQMAEDAPYVCKKVANFRVTPG
jgi:hypothetical protein